MGHFRKAMTFDTSFLGIKTFSNKEFFVIIFFDYFSQPVQREATSIACIARADDFVYDRVKRENDTDRRCQSLNFREHRRYSLFCWRFENNFLLIITSEHSYFLLYIGFEYLSSESARKLGFSEGIPWVSSEKRVVTSHSKEGGGMKTIFYRLNRCVDQSMCFVGRVVQKYRL